MANKKTIRLSKTTCLNFELKKVETRGFFFKRKTSFSNRIRASKNYLKEVLEVKLAREGE